MIVATGLKTLLLVNIVLSININSHSATKNLSTENFLVLVNKCYTRYVLVLLYMFNTFKKKS